MLALKAPIMTVSDDSLKYFFKENKTAWQRIHMKHHALFSLKDKIKIKVSSAAILPGSLRVSQQYVNLLMHSELQIRGSYEDNSKIIFLIFQRKHIL